MCHGLATPIRGFSTSGCTEPSPEAASQILIGVLQSSRGRSDVQTRDVLHFEAEHTGLYVASLRKKYAPKTWLVRVSKGANLLCCGSAGLAYIDWSVTSSSPLLYIQTLACTRKSFSSSFSGLVAPSDDFEARASSLGKRLRIPGLQRRL